MSPGDLNMTESVEVLASPGYDIGENPLWHTDTQKLFFADISPGVIYAFDPLRGNCDVLTRTRITGGFTFQEDGSLMLFQDGRVASLALDGTLREVASGCCPGNDRFNDVIADPEGRVFAGVMGSNACLLRFNLDGSITEIAGGFGCPNGMGFTPDHKGMYFTDSNPRQIYYFDYDRRTGDLSNRRTFAEIPADEGLPDGMTVDADGYVWSALWFGRRLKRYAPDGRLDREVFLPATQISSVTFGGPNMTEMYVTSAASSVADSLRPSGCDPQRPRGGDLYRVRVPGVSGKAPFRSRLRFS